MIELDFILNGFIYTRSLNKKCQVKHKSLLDSLEDSTNPCRWCVTSCPDEDKYEMLITCISIQKEIIKTGRIVYKILADKSLDIMMKTYGFLETITNELQKEHLSISNNIKRENRSEDNWRLPGCSQIFTVAQSLEGIFVNEILRYDWE